MDDWKLSTPVKRQLDRAHEEQGKWNATNANTSHLHVEVGASPRLCMDDWKLPTPVKTQLDRAHKEQATWNATNGRGLNKTDGIGQPIG